MLSLEWRIIYNEEILVAVRLVGFVSLRQNTLSDIFRATFRAKAKLMHPFSFHIRFWKSRIHMWTPLMKSSHTIPSHLFSPNCQIHYHPVYWNKQKGKKLLVMYLQRFNVYASLTYPRILNKFFQIGFLSRSYSLHEQMRKRENSQPAEWHTQWWFALFLHLQEIDF